LIRCCFKKLKNFIVNLAFLERLSDRKIKINLCLN
jgi:hypothetical protein